MGFTLSGRPCVDPVALRQSCLESDPPVPCAPWWGKANRYECPCGQEPGRGWLLMTLGDIGRLNLNGDHELLIADNYGGKISIQGLIVRRGVLVSGGNPDDPTSTYLVEVVDPRWLARNPYFGNPVSRNYNLVQNLTEPNATLLQYAAHTTFTLNANDQREGVLWDWQ